MLDEMDRNSAALAVRDPSQPAVQSPFSPAPFLKPGQNSKPFFATSMGAVWSLDCLHFLQMLRDESVDTVFADPPFNLNKIYGKKSRDDLSKAEYLSWCREWIAESVRCLKPGGALWLYNLPKWNVLLGPMLDEMGMEFRHWIAVSLKLSLPIPGRLYPAHYSLLYYTKGKPRTFRKVRTPIQLCRHCGGEVKDYGGHRGAMNPKGVNLTDVWDDIPPVRHQKYKSSERKANALSSKILDRVVEVSTQPGDMVVDPFGGSGTTFAVCEARHRHWLGTDIDFAPVIKERLTGDLYLHKSGDVLDLD